MTTQYGELTTLWPSNTLNKLTSQATYSNLPTTGAVLKKDKLTLLKAVCQQNNRGSIASVQAASRVAERQRKRAAAEVEVEVEEDESGENSETIVVVTRAVKRARRSGRAAKK